jgi:hypothetical protein
MVRQTRLLPPNLSINSDILCPFLPDGSSLEQELEVCVCVFACLPVSVFLKLLLKRLQSSGKMELDSLRAVGCI